MEFKEILFSVVAGTAILGFTHAAAQDKSSASTPSQSESAGTTPATKPSKKKRHATHDNAGKTDERNGGKGSDGKGERSSNRRGGNKPAEKLEVDPD
jgi:hypothetical protein